MMIKKIGVIGLIALCVLGCDKNNQNDVGQVGPSASEQNTSLLPTQAVGQIDWTRLKTGVRPVNSETYAYPFAIDSLAVKNYANAYQITPKQAQHSMMLAMASPEALGKVLDQLAEGQYLGHSLTDGADMQLVIFTTDAVMPSRFDYVFADKFAEGLILPVVIAPKSQAHTYGTPQVHIAHPAGTSSP